MLPRHAIAVAVMITFCAGDRLPAENSFDPNRNLIFLSTFDDTTDVNLFGFPNDAGWIYTAESTRRKNVLMHSRCPAVSIAKGKGKLRDSLRFADQTKQVLFYQASPNIPAPMKNWAGTVSFWIKPDLAKLGPKASYPLQLTDGNWSNGGFFVRIPPKSKGVLEFGAYSKSAERDVARPTTVAVKDQPLASDQWTMLTFTFARVNPTGLNKSIAKIYLNGTLAGTISQRLVVHWMNTGTPKIQQDGALFLGINYVGDLDDLRIYDRALTAQQIRQLFLQAGEAARGSAARSRRQWNT